MKKIIAITTAILLFAGIFTASAQAGAARRHTIEGIMIGTGVAILGAAIINGVNNHHRPQYATRHAPPAHRAPVYRKDYRHDRRAGYRHYRGPSGHWEIDRVWVEPIYEKKWNPGHYDHRGHWVDGRYERFVVKNGYWHEEKVWVRH